MLSHVIPHCLVTDRIPIKLQLTGKSRLIFEFIITSRACSIEEDPNVPTSFREVAHTENEVIESMNVMSEVHILFPKCNNSQPLHKYQFEM